MLYNVHTGFTGLEAYRKFIRDQRYSASNQKLIDRTDSVIPERIMSNWYGKDVTEAEMRSVISQFKEPGLIEKVYEQVKNNLPESVRSKLKEKRLDFNDREIGTFSMDRFMMGMYYRPVFFNMKSNSHVPPNMVVQKGEKYFYRPDNSPCRKDKKLSTHNKKVYAHFPQLDNDKQAIEIVMVAGANAGTSSREMLYTGIAGIVIGELCEKAGIKVRLSVAIGSDSGGTLEIAIIPMKDFNVPLDHNIMALLTSDGRMFRHEMFKGIIANYNASGRNCPSGLGSLISEYQLQEFYDNEYTKEKYPDMFKSSKVFFTSGIFTESAAIRKINDVITSFTDDESTNN